MMVQECAHRLLYTAAFNLERKGGETHFVRSQTQVFRCVLPTFGFTSSVNMFDGAKGGTLTIIVHCGIRPRK